MFRGFKMRLSSGGNSVWGESSGSANSSTPAAAGGNSDDNNNSSKTPTKFRVTLRKSKDPQYDIALLKSKVTNLASFDTCVESADELAGREDGEARVTVLRALETKMAELSGDESGE